MVFGPQLPGVVPLQQNFPTVGSQTPAVNQTVPYTAQGPLQATNPQSTALATHTTANSFLPNATEQYNRAQENQERLYQNVLGGHDARLTALSGRNEQLANAIRNQQAQGIQSIGDQWASERADAIGRNAAAQATAYSQLNQGMAGLDNSFQNRLNTYTAQQRGGGGVLPGYDTRQTALDQRQNTIDALASSSVNRATDAEAALNAGYQARRDNAANLLAQRGATARRDLDQRFDEQRAQSIAAMKSRGLGNTTMLNNANAQIERNRQREHTALEDQLRDDHINQLAQFEGERLAAQGQNVDRTLGQIQNRIGAQQGGRDIYAQTTGERLGAQDNAAMMQAQLDAERLGQVQQGIQANVGQLNDNRRELETIDSGYLFPQLSFAENSLGNQVALGEDQRSSDQALLASLTGDRLGYMGSRLYESPALTDIYNFAMQGSSEFPQSIGAAQRAPTNYSYSNPNSSRVYQNAGVNYGTDFGAAYAAGIANRAFQSAATPRNRFGMPVSGLT